jgi:hypothetical protein
MAKKRESQLKLPKKLLQIRGNADCSGIDRKIAVREGGVVSLV